MVEGNGAVEIRQGHAQAVGDGAQGFRREAIVLTMKRVQQKQERRGLCLEFGNDLIFF